MGSEVHAAAKRHLQTQHPYVHVYFLCKSQQPYNILCTACNFCVNDMDVCVAGSRLSTRESSQLTCLIVFLYTPPWHGLLTSWPEGP